MTAASRSDARAEVLLTDADVEAGARALFEHFHQDRRKYGGVYEWPAPEQHLPWWRDAARAVLAARIEQARAGEGALRERVEAMAKVGLRGFDLTPTMPVDGQDSAWWYGYLRRHDNYWRSALESALTDTAADS